MRAGKIGRGVVRAVIVGLLALGAWAAATMVAHAEMGWEIAPQDGPTVEQPVVRPR
jgi:hypothetical protein